MIRFNNYPPNGPEDVDFAESANKILGFRPARYMDAIGETIGITLMAAFNDGESEAPYVGVLNTANKLIEEVGSATFPAASEGFSRGIVRGIKREMTEEQEAELLSRTDIEEAIPGLIIRNRG